MEKSFHGLAGGIGYDQIILRLRAVALTGGSRTAAASG